MARKYPPGRFRQIPRNYTNSRRKTTRAVVLHTTASASATSMFGWFSNPAAQASSQFHTDVAGVTEQYMDADLIAWASAAGNATTVAIETQGDGTKPWSAAQYKELVRLVAWLCRVYGIPATLMPDSKPNSRGIGSHRLGIDGTFPATGIQRGRLQRGGGEIWSSARGKVCPGDARQAQLPALVQAVLDRNEALRAKAAAEAAAKAASSGKASLYTVKRGDTLSAIAKARGVTVAALVKANRLKDKNVIRVGQRLTIPAKAKDAKPGWYTVTGLKAGATLNGRASGSLKARVKFKRRNGFHIYVDHIVKTGGITWAVSNHGTYYRTAYLTKGKK